MKGRDGLNKLFAYDGKLMWFLTKLGELVMVSAAFIICCLPVVTIGPAATSLYYSVIKSIRRGRGTPVREFFSSMKRILGKGCLITAALLVWFAALYMGRRQALGTERESGQILAGAYMVVTGLSVCIMIYIFPILSRFTMRITGMVKLSFVMCIRFLPITAAVAAGTAVVGWLQIYVLPIPCVLFTPGAWCLVVTFMMEKALLAYMPKPKEGEDAWYYGGKEVKARGQEDSECLRRKEVRNEA